MASRLVTSHVDMSTLSSAKEIIEIEQETGLARFIDVTENDDSFALDEHCYLADGSLSAMSDSDFAEDGQTSFIAFAPNVSAKDKNGIFHTEHVSGRLAVADQEEVRPVYGRSGQVRSDSEASIYSVENEKESLNQVKPTSDTVHGRIPCVSIGPISVETTENVLKRNIAIPAGVVAVKNNKTTSETGVNKSLKTTFNSKGVPAKNKDICASLTQYDNLECKSKFPRLTNLYGRNSCRSNKNGASNCYIVANAHKNLVTYKKVTEKSDYLLKGNAEKDKENVRETHAAKRCRSDAIASKVARNTDERNNQDAYFKQTSKYSKARACNNNKLETADTKEKYKKALQDRGIETRYQTLLKGRYIKIKLKDIMCSKQMALRTLISDRSNRLMIKDDNIQRLQKEPKKEVLFKNNCVKHIKVMLKDIMKDKAMRKIPSNNRKHKVSSNKIKTRKAKHVKNKEQRLNKKSRTVDVVNNDEGHVHSRTLSEVRDSAAKYVNSEDGEHEMRSISDTAVQPTNSWSETKNGFNVTALQMEGIKDNTNDARPTRIRKKTPKALALEQLEKTKNYRRYLHWFMRQQRDKRNSLDAEKGIKGNRAANKQGRRKLDEMYKLNESESSKTHRLRIKDSIMKRFNVKQYTLSQRCKQRQNYINTLRYQKPYPVLLIRATWNYWHTQQALLKSVAINMNEENGFSNGSLGDTHTEENELVTRSRKESCDSVSFDEQSNLLTVVKAEPVSLADLSGSGDGNEKTEQSLVVEENELYTVIRNETRSPTEPLVHSGENETFIGNENNTGEVVEQNELYTVIRNYPTSLAESVADLEGNELFVVNRNNSFTSNGNEQIAPCIGVKENEQYAIVKAEPSSPREQLTCDEFREPLTAGTGTGSCTAMHKLPLTMTASHNQNDIPVLSPVLFFGKPVHLPYSGSIDDHNNLQFPMVSGFISGSACNFRSKLRAGPGVDRSEEDDIQAAGVELCSDDDEEIDVVSVDPVEQIPVFALREPASTSITTKQGQFYCKSYIKTIHSYCIPVQNETSVMRFSELDEVQLASGKNTKQNTEGNKPNKYACATPHESRETQMRANKHDENTFSRTLSEYNFKHNANERKRRLHCRRSFQRLRDCIPELEGNNNASKQLILDKACSLIKHLKIADTKGQIEVAYLTARHDSLNAILDESTGLKSIRSCTGPSTPYYYKA